MLVLPDPIVFTLINVQVNAALEAYRKAYREAYRKAYRKARIVKANQRDSHHACCRDCCHVYVL